PGDADSGPDGLQNFPVLTSAVLDGAQVVISGKLDSLPGATFRVELFSGDPSAGAATPIGALDVTTDPSGDAPFTFTAASLPAGSVVTATATRPAGAGGDTSEFSAAVAVSMQGAGSGAPAPARVHLIAVGADAGAPAVVRVFDVYGRPRFL